MSTPAAQPETAKEILFGQNGVGASNFKLFPGSSRDVSAEQLAEEIAGSLRRVIDGQTEEIEI